MSLVKIASPSLLAVVLLASAGCQDSEVVGANGELAARLGTEPVTLAVVGTSSASVLAYDANGALVPMQPLAIEGGTVTVENDGNGALVVDDFHIELADVVAEHGANETHPRTLTNVSVSLGRPLTLTSPWSDDGTGAHANAHGDLRLDWAIVDEATGQPAPLTSDSWQNVEINVYLHAEDDGSVSAHIASTIEGRVLATWGIELSDFLMNVRATDS